ncbi:hypothetical protein ABZ885_08675, partial [Kitasatospora sp. NPDC047058]
MPAQARRIALPRAARIGIATAVTGAAFALPLVTAISAQAHTAPAAKPAQTSTWTGATSVASGPLGDRGRGSGDPDPRQELLLLRVQDRPAG